MSVAEALTIAADRLSPDLDKERTDLGHQIGGTPGRHPEGRVGPNGRSAADGLVPAIAVCGLSRTFHTRRGVHRALDQVSFTIAPGEMVALLGASGSGKSTLMRLLSGLLVADRAEQTGQGEAVLGGVVVQRGGRLGREVRKARCGTGLVFQQFNLVARLPVLANVLVGMVQRVPLWRTMLRWYTAAEQQRAMQALARVGMESFATQRASTLSGGQQQRAAIARALAQGARTILGDEPIASLDPESAHRVMETLADINRQDQVTVLVSLHQVDYARSYCPRTIALRDGRVVYDGPTAALTPALLAAIYGGDAVNRHLGMMSDDR